MKKGLRQAIAFLLVIAMACSFALAGIEDEFPEGDRGKRGKLPAYNEGDLVVLFTKYELNMDAGTSTKLNGIPGTFRADGPCPRCDVVYYLWKNYIG